MVTNASTPQVVKECPHQASLLAGRLPTTSEVLNRPASSVVEEHLLTGWELLVSVNPSQSSWGHGPRLQASLFDANLFE